MNEEIAQAREVIVGDITSDECNDWRDFVILLVLDSEVASPVEPMSSEDCTRGVRELLALQLVFQASGACYTQGVRTRREVGSHGVHDKADVVPGRVSLENAQRKSAGWGYPSRRNGGAYGSFPVGDDIDCNRNGSKPKTGKQQKGR